MFSLKFKIYSMVYCIYLFHSSSTAYLLVYRGKISKVHQQNIQSCNINRWLIILLLLLFPNPNFKASGSPRDKTKERQDEIEQPDQRRGYKGKERKKASPVHQGRGEEGDAKRKKVSSFNEDMIKADPQHLRNQRQNRSHSSKQHSRQSCKGRDNIKLSDSAFFLWGK